VASRRGADELIAQGRVTVNGRVVREAGTRVTPGADAVVVDGAPARPEERSLVLMFYKPRGVVTTLDDPRASRTLAPWLENRGERLYPIGRLDRDSEGLLLLTNDGDLANRLTHPRYHVDKEYRVTVRGVLTPEMARRLETGIELDDGPTLPATVREAKVSGDRTRFLLVLREGRKRQIRRMCEALELPVIRLIRRRVGPIRMTRMKAGDLRPLTPSEIRRLRAAVGSPAPRPSPPRRRSRSES
jgi:pseudouridine synthase